MEESRKKHKAELFRRYLVFGISLFIIACGISLITRSNLGTSPITSVPYVASLHTPVSLGTYFFLFTLVLIGMQLLLLGRRGIMERKNGTPHAVSGGLRIVCLYRPRHVDDCRILPGSLLCENHLAGYRLRGTGSRNLPGSHSRCDDDQRRIYHTICHPTLQEKLRQHQNLLRRDPGSLRYPVFMGAVGPHRGSDRGNRDCRPDYRPVRPTDYAPPGLRPSLASRTGYPCHSSSVAAPAHYPPVITISREYGSGGHQIGKALAKELGITFYDKELITLVAKESGFSEEFISQNEQKMPSALLYQMVMQDYEAPLDKSLSYDDALFVAQSRVIRRLAAEKPCVIVGRCADYILRDRPHTLHIFLFGDMKSKTERVISEYGISAAQAPGKITQVDKSRKEHYFHYTGRQWGDSRNYHATFNTSLISTTQVTEALKRIYEEDV